MKMANGNGTKNEKKNLSNFFIVFACAILFFCSGYFTAFFHYRAKSVAIRVELRELEERESTIRATIADFTRRTESIYEGSFDSIAAIREATALLQDYINDFISDINCADSDDFDY